MYSNISCFHFLCFSIDVATAHLLHLSKSKLFRNAKNEYIARAALSFYSSGGYLLPSFPSLAVVLDHSES